MSDRCKKLLAKYSISACVGFAIVFFVLSNRGFFGADDTALRMLYLADAFTIPGVLFLMVGVMTWLSGKGLFDGLTYSLGRLARTLVPLKNTTDEKYYDYKVRKNESRKNDYAFLFIVGGVLFLVAVVFTIINMAM